MKTIYFTTTNSWRYFTAFVYICFVLFIGLSAARQGLSHYYADNAIRTGSEIDLESAIYYQPENPDAHKARGVILLRNKDYSAAAEAFEQAISLRENDFLLWLRLGYSRHQLKDFDAAQVAYEKALMLAPNYSEPNFYIGRMLLESGRTEQAFKHLSRAAEYDMTLFPRIRRLARVTFPDDPLAIEKALAPKSIEAKRSVARYLIKYHFMTENVRSFLTGDELTGNEKNEFVSYLIRKRNFQIAREVWLSKLKTENVSIDQLIFDGSFEKITESDESGFGWQIEQKVSAISVALEEKNFHSGSRSVLIKFAGNVEMNRKLISQLVYLKPNTKYQLKFYFYSTELISAGLPRVIISDGVSKKVLGSSEALKATDRKWAEVKADFMTKGAPVASISLQRPNCNTSPCPIFGEISLDDFSLTEN